MKIEEATKFAHNVGHKLQQGVELGMALKGIYDAGKVVYAGATVAAPYVMGVASML